MSAETLRKAAARMREDFGPFPDGAGGVSFVLAVADWLEAEAAHSEEFALKGLAINLLLRTADNAEEINAQISMGYETYTQALAAARAYLLGESA